ncbi:unnamed protein product [Phaeothamnion confervicola]
MTGTILAGLLSLAAVVYNTGQGPWLGFGATRRDFSKIPPPRPIPSPEEQARLRDQWLAAITTIEDAGERGEAVRLRALLPADQGGHRRLPASFYDSIHFGISARNPYGVELSARENKRRTAELRTALAALPVPPTALLPTRWDNADSAAAAAAAGRRGGGAGNKKGGKDGGSGSGAAANAEADGSFQDEGITVRYAIADLLKASSAQPPRPHTRKDPAWTAAEAEVMKVARRFEQFKIYVWHPLEWGPGTAHDRHIHTSVLQEVRPCRTGTNGFRSTAVVYQAPLP